MPVYCQLSWLWLPKRTASLLYPWPSLGTSFGFISNLPAHGLIKTVMVAIELLDAAAAGPKHRRPTALATVASNLIVCPLLTSHLITYVGSSFVEFVISYYFISQAAITLAIVDNLPHLTKFKSKNT